MRATLVFSMIVALTLTAACGEETSIPVAGSESAAANLTPEQLGELGAQIAKEPARADELLSRHGLNERNFEEAIRQVTQDPEASKRYRDAYQRASA